MLIRLLRDPACFLIPTRRPDTPVKDLAGARRLNLCTFLMRRWTMAYSA
jgi:hypothetical protein